MLTPEEIIAAVRADALALAERASQQAQQESRAKAGTQTQLSAVAREFVPGSHSFEGGSGTQAGGGKSKGRGQDKVTTEKGEGKNNRRDRGENGKGDRKAGGGGKNAAKRGDASAPTSSTNTKSTSSQSFAAGSSTHNHDLVDDGNECLICAKEQCEFMSVGKCNHLTCSVCMLRLRLVGRAH